VAIGLPEKSAVIVLWGLAGLGAVTAWAIRQVPLEWSILAVALCALSMALFAVFLMRVNVYGPTDRLLIQSGRATAIIVDFMHKRSVATVLLDFLLITVAYYGAYRLRFEGDLLKEHFPQFIQSLPIVIAIQITTLFIVGAYRGVWRYFSLMDGVVLAKAVGLGTLVIEFVVLYVYRFEHYSRSVFVIYATLLMLVATGSRASFRVMLELIRRRRLGDRLVIYGAGDGGALAMRELTSRDRAPVRLLGFIDDDLHKHRTRVDDYPVLGGYDSLVALITGGAVDQLVVSMQLIDKARLVHLEQLCAAHSIKLFRLQFRLEPMATVS
jgi:UDP-GlcNAc:undecaprenyl-phosphate GlcNAc-1-phosphate transferase